jgi:hypothetical protein
MMKRFHLLFFCACFVVGCDGCGEACSRTLAPAATEESPALEQAEPASDEPEPARHAPDAKACARVVVVGHAGVRETSVAKERTEDEARARASELRRRVVEDGEDMASVASEASDLLAHVHGGLGVVRYANWPPQLDSLRDEVFDLDVGHVTEVLQVPVGYAFVQRCSTEAVSVRHAVVRHKGARDAPSDLRWTRAKARRRAEVLRRELQEGLDWDELAAVSGPDDGQPILVGSEQVGHGYHLPSVAAAALALAPGEVSAVLESDYGYHVVVRVEE